jgi:hypothetical protein
MQKANFYGKKQRNFQINEKYFMENYQLQTLLKFI